MRRFAVTAGFFWFCVCQARSAAPPTSFAAGFWFWAGSSARERQLKDEQEELWRAQRLLRQVVREAGNTELGRQAARLGVTCVRRISERFDRLPEMRAVDIELSKWLANPARQVKQP
ncbi:MAG: hypothetical protein K2X03_09880 [Bryobacteraceae bacterium]|nr:hypothetical protein [Bryobacteraceae bacterium]